MIMHTIHLLRLLQRVARRNEDVNLVPQRALLESQLADERRGLAFRTRVQREGGDTHRMPELWAAELAQEMLLVPDVASRLDAPPVIHVEGGLISIRRPRIAGEPYGLRTCSRDKFAISENEADFA